ncbi:unnamed protein product, partial [Lampetra planeri]
AARSSSAAAVAGLSTRKASSSSSSTAAATEVLRIFARVLAAGPSHGTGAAGRPSAGRCSSQSESVADVARPSASPAGVVGREPVTPGAPGGGTAGSTLGGSNGEDPSESDAPPHVWPRACVVGSRTATKGFSLAGRWRWDFPSQCINNPPSISHASASPLPRPRSLTRRRNARREVSSICNRPHSVAGNPNRESEPCCAIELVIDAASSAAAKTGTGNSAGCLHRPDPRRHAHSGVVGMRDRASALVGSCWPHGVQCWPPVRCGVYMCNGCDHQQGKHSHHHQQQQKGTHKPSSSSSAAAAAATEAASSAATTPSGRKSLSSLSSSAAASARKSVFIIINTIIINRSSIKSAARKSSSS